MTQRPTTDIEPLVPELPRPTDPSPVPDGGTRRPRRPERLTCAERDRPREELTPLVPDLR